MISVCMASYNGEQYIRKQVESILANITSADELIISDDGSTDNTLEILKWYSVQNTNIKILNGPKLGVVKNFENAIKNAKGNIIFLADQDDVWEKNKVEVIINHFEQNDCWMVVHDARLIDESGKEIMSSFYSLRNSKSGLVKNFYKNSYIGCCMAFKKDLIEFALPFPSKIPMHDWWLGMISEVYSKSIFIEDKLIGYRRHSSNVTGINHLPVTTMLKNRIFLFLELVKLFIKR